MTRQRHAAASVLAVALNAVAAEQLAQGACARYVRPTQWTCHAQIARICCGRISGRSKTEKHQQTGLFKRRKQPLQARLSAICACDGQPVELLQAAQAA